MITPQLLLLFRLTRELYKIDNRNNKIFIDCFKFVPCTIYKRVDKDRLKLNKIKFAIILTRL